MCSNWVYQKCSYLFLMLGNLGKICKHVSHGSWMSHTFFLKSQSSTSSPTTNHHLLHNKNSHSLHACDNNDHASAPIPAMPNANCDPHLIWMHNACPPHPTPISQVPTSPKVRASSFLTLQCSLNLLMIGPTLMASQLHPLQWWYYTSITPLHQEWWSRFQARRLGCSHIQPSLSLQGSPMCHWSDTDNVSWVIASNKLWVKWSNPLYSTPAPGHCWGRRKWAELDACTKRRSCCIAKLIPSSPHQSSQCSSQDNHCHCDHVAKCAYRVCHFMWCSQVRCRWDL